VRDGEFEEESQKRLFDAVEVLNRSRDERTSRGVTTAQTDESIMAAAASDLKRFMLWIDAVGGYLVHLADELVVGQSAPGSAADIALQSDISRKHAKIARISGGYLIEPLNGKVVVNGRSATGSLLLSDGDEVQLGATVKMRFRKPHVLSSSARLEITTGHRSHPHADAILLMAESCVLGPKGQNHIVCHDWTSDVVLYRNSGQLFCRAAGPIEIDGKHYKNNGPIRPGSHVVGTDFSFTIELV
jgi:hypothetical protein